MLASTHHKGFSGSATDRFKVSGDRLDSLRVGRVVEVQRLPENLALRIYGSNRKIYSLLEF